MILVAIFASIIVGFFAMLAIVGRPRPTHLAMFTVFVVLALAAAGQI